MNLVLPQVELAVDLDHRFDDLRVQPGSDLVAKLVDYAQGKRCQLDLALE